MFLFSDKAHNQVTLKLCNIFFINSVCWVCVIINYLFRLEENVMPWIGGIIQKMARNINVILMVTALASFPVAFTFQPIRVIIFHII